MIETEHEMTRSELFELMIHVRQMRFAMHKILEVAEQDGVGMSHGFCDKYPFHMSFDELLHEVIEWESEIDRKHREACNYSLPEKS